MLWLLFACAFSTHPSIEAVQGESVAPADPGSSLSGTGCVQNRDRQTAYDTLQEAFDAAHDGDVLVLCEWTLEEGGTTDRRVEIQGGVVWGAVSLTAGTVSGANLRSLVVPSGFTIVEGSQIDSLTIEGQALVSQSEVGSLAVSGGATVKDSTLGNIDVSGEIDLRRSECRDLWLGGQATLDTVSLDQLQLDGGALVASDLHLTGGWDQLGGEAEVAGLEMEDPGRTGFAVEDGRLLLRDASVVDTGVDSDHRAFVLSGGEISLQEVTVTGFGGGALEAEAVTLSLEGVQLDATARISGGALSVDGFLADAIELDEVEASLSGVDGSSLWVVGGSLDLQGSTFGGVTGEAMVLDLAQVRLVDVQVASVDGRSVELPLEDGSLAVGEEGGTAILVRGGRLEIESVQVLDSPYGLVAEEAEVTGEGLTAWRTWQAGVQLTDSSLDLSTLWVGEGRGWGLVATRSTIRLTAPTLSDLGDVRRKTTLYDAEGNRMGELLTIIGVPGLSGNESDLTMVDPFFEELDADGLEWVTGPGGGALHLEGGTFAGLGRRGLVVVDGGGPVDIQIDGLTIEDLEEVGVSLFGAGRGAATLANLTVRSSRAGGIEVEGIPTLTMKEIAIEGVDEDGLHLQSASALLIDGLSLEAVAGTGLTLEGGAGTIRGIVLYGAGEVGLLADGAQVGLEECLWTSVPVGLSCTGGATLDPCTDQRFDQVPKAEEGCGCN